jgi:hypothetical protein
VASTEITIFRGRRCKLFIAHQDASGNVSEYIEIINGFIESSPHIESGETISLSILPLLCLVDGKLADTKAGIAYLLHGFHYYSSKHNIFEYGSAFQNSYVFQSVTAEEYPTPGVASTQTKIYVDSPSFDLNNIFDESRSDGTGFIDTHPRYPLLLIMGIFKAYPIQFGYTSNQPFIIIDHTVTDAATQARLLSPTTGVWPTTGTVSIAIPKRGEVKRVSLGENRLKRFPDVLNDSLNLSGPSGLTGVSGAFHSVRFNGNRLVVTPLADQRGNHKGRVHLWYSSEWYEESPNFNYAYWPADDIEDREALNNEYRIYYPLDYWNDDTKPNNARGSNKIKVIELPDSRAESVSIEVNVALAYKSTLEPHILVDKSLGLPSTLGPTRYGIQVQTFDYYTKEVKTLKFIATHQEAVSFNSVDVGYLIHVPNIRANINQGHFGDWRGEDRSQITVGVASVDITPGAMMLSILQSGGGGNNGAYDNLGVGLSIHQDDIDVSSFITHGTANILSLDTSFSVDDFDARKFIDSLLKSIGCIITMKRAVGGPSKITLQPIGVETESSVAATINNADMLTQPLPHYDIYEDVVTQINVKYGWDNQENKFLDTATFNNQDAINRYGGEKSSIDIELYGLNIQDVGAGAGDIYNYLLPLASRVFNTLSYPMLNWHFAISSGQSIYLDVGSYVKVSSPHLKSYSDDYGITNEIGMIKTINQQLMSEGCTLEVIHTGIKVVNWNSTMKVTFVTSTNELTVASSEYSSDDTAFFKAGDIVDFLPFGDEDNSTTGLEIQSIVGTTITFTAAHGVSTLGTLEPTTYLNASDDHKADAYLSNGTILGTTDKAQEYA